MTSHDLYRLQVTGIYVAAIRSQVWVLAWWLLAGYTVSESWREHSVLPKPLICEKEMIREHEQELSLILVTQPVRPKGIIGNSH